MSDASSKTRLTRTRTGCFKCRVRRRKCDEGKPSCRRCIDGGFECQYGTRLSFLEKNAKTTGETDRVSKPTYGKLRFVVPESVIAQDSVRLQEDDGDDSKDAPKESKAVANPTKKEHATTLQQESSNSQSQSQFEGHPTELFSSPPNLLHIPLDNLATPPSGGGRDYDLQHQGDYTVSLSPSDAAYETALDGLLSLGNDHHVPPRVSSHTLQLENYLVEPPSSLHHDLSPNIFANASKTNTSSFQNCIHLPQDREVQLLRHYRYNIAPWLDIGDPEQTFGLVIPPISIESMPVLNSLLALASITLDQHLDSSFDTQLTALPDPEESSAIDMLHGALIFVFTVLCRHIIVSPTSWRSPSKNIAFGLLNSGIFHERYPSINLALSWMALRLELSVGLMNGSPVSIPDTISYSATSPMNLVSWESFRYGHEPILLCAQVLNHCFGHCNPATPRVPGHASTAQNWKSLTDSLHMWYTNRPQDFKSVWEGDESDQIFPLVLFTNGTAILANQLYHTSMLLLLQNRPRTLPKEHGRSVHVSPLWHAQRICAISLNNDLRTNWDFSLLASFYLAAKRMTYEPQQEAIIRGIDRIGSLTGWNVNALSAQLVQEWQPD
ncbi:hypothetical protein BGZ63DRAFT_423615 [Mariannaea sp. PMI_226]|nr:hypothetical protein BGZ63DRAFT_423615 [Mariannaea sp. PMI_226]